MRTIRKIIFVSSVFLLLAPRGAALATQDTATIMRQIYDAIAYLLPLSLRDPAESSVWDDELIEQKLRALTNASDALRKHTAGQEREFSHIAASFEQMSGSVVKAFSNEWPEFAYFSLMDLVQHCVACHSRLPAASQPLFGEKLIARMDTRDMPSEDVIKLFIAVRQFDAALNSIEKTILDQSLKPIEADYTSLLVDYLQIAISAKRSPILADRLLQQYLAREDLPYYLKRRFAFWRKALDKFASDITGTPNFERAKTIFYGADALSRAPGNRIRAVHDITAASILRAHLAQGSELSPQELSEAYYILGVVALRTLDAKSAVPEMEMLFAESIKAKPSSSFASEAYALIEEYGYVHEDNLAAPTSEQTLIDMPALRALIDRP